MADKVKLTERKWKRDWERCAGGYLVRGNRLCGRSGNNCRDYCAFEYRKQPTDAGRAHLASSGKTEK